MKHNFLIIQVLALAALISCKDNTTVQVASTLSLSNTEYSFTVAGGEESLTLTSNTNWTVKKPDVVWIDVNPLYGSGDATIVVKVKENRGGARKDSLVFTTADKKVSQSLVLKQEKYVAPPDPDKIFTEKFSSSQGAFTIEDKQKPDEIEAIWQHDPDGQGYGMVATAYSGGDNGVNYASESWLISPEIDLTNRASAYMLFDHAGNHFDVPKLREQATLKVTADNGSTWNDVLIPKYPSGQDWNFVRSGIINLSDYLGGKIKFAFVYKSTAEKAGTWEIKNVAITVSKPDVPEDEDMGDTYNGVPVWMELPEVTNEETFHIHALNENGVRYRNYSMNYDETHLVATWTAYPLCDWYRGTAGRSEDWVINPFVENQAIMYRADDWNEPNGFHRGHQIPSADRTRSEYFNQQTFYYTNAAPMYKDKEFNSGIWGDLEDKVREWSSAGGTDTLYVVTGAIVKEGGKTVLDNKEKPCTVPEAYYKALLRYKKGADVPYMAAGFYLNHVQNQSGTIFDNAMSLSELEEKTGLKFFVNLEAAVGKEEYDRIKAEDPADNTFWK